MPLTIWRNPLQWVWTYDEEPGAGGTEYSVAITADKIEWRYSEDRWGRSDDQTFPDFGEFGPLWDTPAEIKSEMAAHFGLSGKPWQAPGYRDYSPIWWLVDQKKEDEAVVSLKAEDVGRRYHGQQTLLMPAIQNQSGRIVKRLLELGADTGAADEHGVTPLMMACKLRPPSPNVMQLLVDHGADVNARDRNGRTAFDYLSQGETKVSQNAFDILLGTDTTG